MGATQAVFELVLARGVMTPGGEHSGLVHVWWRAPLQGERLVQVYVDGVLVYVTSWAGERKVWLTVDRGRGHRIELLAVDAVDALIAHPRSLGCWADGSGVVDARVLRDEQLRVDSVVSVSVDGEVLDEGSMWNAWDHRGGFGALFGLGPFGMDDATGPGLGMGELGYGRLGTDGTAWRWRRSDLSSGMRDVLIEARGGDGQLLAERDVGLEAVEAIAGSAQRFDIDADYIARWG